MQLKLTFYQLVYNILKPPLAASCNPLWRLSYSGQISLISKLFLQVMDYFTNLTATKRHFFTTLCDSLRLGHLLSTFSEGRLYARAQSDIIPASANRDANRDGRVSSSASFLIATLCSISLIDSLIDSFLMASTCYSTLIMSWTWIWAGMHMQVCAPRSVEMGQSLPVSPTEYF